MRIEFEDSNLERLYSDPTFHDPRFGSELTKHFRKRVQLIVAALDERDLRNLRGLRLEKLLADRRGQHSVRLNDQFRLIVRLEPDSQGQLAVIVEITDYH